MKRITLLLAVLYSIVSAAVAQKVRVDYDHSCNFSSYRTYRLMPRTVQVSNAEFPNQLIEERIAGFTKKALDDMGLRNTQTNADLQVTYEVVLTEEPQFTTYTDAIGPGWGCCSWTWGWGASWSTGWSTTTVQNIPIGTLVINMIDVRQNHLVFQGVSTATIRSKAEKNNKMLQKGINEIFEKYPGAGR